MPTIWGLDTGRMGEFMQVVALATALDLDFEPICLSAKGDILSALPAEPPCLIISFGRAASVALALASRFLPRPLLVHLGTPGHTPITAFDLIIPMPQDDYPRADNIYMLRLPLNGATLTPPLKTDHAGKICTVIIGGESRYFQLPAASIRQIVTFSATLAKANDESLLILTSPRTPTDAISELQQLQKPYNFSLALFGDHPLQTHLAAGSRFVVTQDSASLIADTYRTGKPVWVFELPRKFDRSKVLQDLMDACLGSGVRHWCIRRGWLGGGMNFKRWHRQLAALGYVRMAGSAATATLTPSDLRWTPDKSLPDTDLEQCRILILEALQRHMAEPNTGRR